MPGGIIPPPSVILSWPEPNYVDPVTEGPALVFVGIILSAIAILLVAARIYSRLFITRAPGIDDLLILISLAFSITLTVLVIIGNKKYGSGRHVWDVIPSEFVGNRQNVWLSEWCYIVATCSVKLSVLLFYRRLSSGFNQRFLIATWIGIAYNIFYLVTFLIMIGFACRPAKAYWLQLDPEWAPTHKFFCIDEHISLPTSAATSVLGDFYSTLIPCILILKLDLPRSQKLALYSLFLLGFLVVAAGIVRTFFINYLINETYDNTWYLWKFWIWTLVEVYIAIIAASAPALKPFFRRFLVEPIASKRGAYSAYGREHKNQSRIEREANRKLWSNTSISVPLADNCDVEKIGMAVNGDSTRKYELRTLPSGKVEPVQVNVEPQESLDPQSDLQASSLYPNENNEWVLPPMGRSDDGCQLMTYRAEIECLPRIPSPGRNPLVVAHGSGRRSVTPNRLIRNPIQHGNPSSIPGYSSPPTVRGEAEGDGSRDLTRRLSQGSVKAARLRVQSVRKTNAEVTAARRMTVKRAVASPSQEPDDSDSEFFASNGASSDEALHLPKQCNVVGGNYDDKSLKLPRQGVIEDDGFRQSSVGFAV